MGAAVWASPIGRRRDFWGATVTFVLAVVHCSVTVNINSSSSSSVRLHGTY